MSVTVIDGGFGTLLARHLGDSVNSDPLWSARSLVEHPDLVVQAHLEYARAGAQVIRTNSYQASVAGFKQHLGMEEEAALRVIKSSVDMARKAINTFVTQQIDTDQELGMPPLLVGSVGPYGACLHDGSEYSGAYGASVSEEQLLAWHRPRVRALSEAGVRLLAVETIPALHEARAVLRLLKTEFPHLRAWLSFSCKDAGHIAEGTEVSAAVSECWRAGRSQLEAVGVNCVPPDWVSPLLSAVRRVDPAIPLIAYPNSGETWAPDVGWQQQGSLPPVSSYVAEWVRLGARYVGGCCRTYPEDTRLILQQISKLTTK